MSVHEGALPGACAGEDPPPHVNVYQFDPLPPASLVAKVLMTVLMIIHDVKIINMPIMVVLRTSLPRVLRESFPADRSIKSPARAMRKIATGGTSSKTANMSTFCASLKKSQNLQSWQSVPHWSDLPHGTNGSHPPTTLLHLSQVLPAH